MLSINTLREMSSEQLRETIKEVFHVAIEELLTRDMDLLVSSAHEQAICHRLGVYLEKYTDLHVDCEYNRNMMRAKLLSDGRRFRPDIIIHRRLSNDQNILAVETKARAQGGVSDLDRLAELTAELSNYGYRAGVFVIFHNRIATMARSGVLRVKIQWVFRSEAEAPIEIDRPIPNELLQRAAGGNSGTRSSRSILRRNA